MRYRLMVLDGAHAVSQLDIEALDDADARRSAAARGLRVVSVDRISQVSRARVTFPLVSFTQQLVSLLGAGLNLTEAIDALAEKETTPAVRQVLDAVRRALSQGETLSAAMARCGDAFPALYVATVRASERTGSIAEALSRYAAYQEQVDVLRRRVTSALVYPTVLLVAGFLVLVFLVGFVVPRFGALYEDAGRDLPWASRVLMDVGRLVSTHGSLLGAGVAAAVVALVLWLRHPSSRRLFSSMLASVPALGSRARLFQLARFYRTTGMLLRGGLPAVSALEMSSGLLGASLGEQLRGALRDVTAGRSMAESLGGHGLTTPVADRLLRVGEQGGEMGEMMERIARFYDEELAQFVDVATRLVEPAIMAFIGLVIGGVVLLMYFPIFELAGAVQ